MLAYYENTQQKTHEAFSFFNYYDILLDIDGYIFAYVLLFFNEISIKFSSRKTVYKSSSFVTDFLLNQESTPILRPFIAVLNAVESFSLSLSFLE